jgi:hypothetical protein
LASQWNQITRPSLDITRYADRSGLPDRNISGGFHAPALFVIGMNLLIPADGIFQPFLLRKAQRRFNLGAHIRFAYALVQVSHEDHSGYLLDDGAITRFHIQRPRLGRARSGVLKEHTGQVAEDRFRVGHAVGQAR